MEPDRIYITLFSLFIEGQDECFAVEGLYYYGRLLLLRKSYLTELSCTIYSFSTQCGLDR